MREKRENLVILMITRFQLVAGVGFESHDLRVMSHRLNTILLLAMHLRMCGGKNRISVEIRAAQEQHELITTSRSDLEKQVKATEHLL